MNSQNNIKELYEEIFRKINDVIFYSTGDNTKKEIYETNNMILKANGILKNNMTSINEAEANTYRFYYALCNGCMSIFHLIDEIKDVVGQQNTKLYEKTIGALDEADNFINIMMNDGSIRTKIEKFLFSSKATIEYYRALIIVPNKNSGIK